MDDPRTEDRSNEMEEDLHTLEDHIEDAEQKLQGRKEAAGNVDGVDEVAGEPQGAQDSSGGEDPKGAEDADERVDEEMANPT